MTKDLALHPIIRLSHRLYPFRRWFFGIPILILLLNVENLYYPYGKHFYDEVVESAAFTVVLIGAMIRLWASGYSRRAVTRRKKKVFFHFRDHGAYSMVRQPYFLADLVIVIGLSIPLMNAALITLSLALFLLFYLPQVVASETLLLHRFQGRYKEYCERVRLVLPSVKHWKRGRSKFRWIFALRKEGNLLTSLGILCFGIEQVRELAVDGRWDLDPRWFAMLIPFIALFFFMRIFDRSLEDLQDAPNVTDYDE